MGKVKMFFFFPWVAWKGILLYPLLSPQLESMGVVGLDCHIYRNPHKVTCRYSSTLGLLMLLCLWNSCTALGDMQHGAQAGTASVDRLFHTCVREIHNLFDYPTPSTRARRCIAMIDVALQSHKMREACWDSGLRERVVWWLFSRLVPFRVLLTPEVSSLSHFCLCKCLLSHCLCLLLVNAHFSINKSLQMSCQLTLPSNVK